MRQKNYQTGGQDLSNLGPDGIVDALSNQTSNSVEKSNNDIYTGVPVESLGILKSDVDLKKISRINYENENGNWEPYIETHLWKLERDIDKIKPFFQDRVVVDLGAGGNDGGYHLANLACAKAYVGIEPFNSNILQGRVKEYHDSPGPKSIPYSVVDLDMLAFLKNLKDDSVSMIASGIDDAIIHDWNYTSPLKKEIQRTLHPQGGLLSIMSELYFPDENKQIILDDSSSYLGNQVAILRK